MDLKKIWKKAVEKTLEPKSTKQHVVEGAVGAVVMLALGGALVPVVAGSVVSGYVAKKVTDRMAAKKAANRDADNNGPKPPSA